MPTECEHWDYYSKKKKKIRKKLHSLAVVFIQFKPRKSWTLIFKRKDKRDKMLVYLTQTVGWLNVIICYLNGKEREINGDV